MPAFFVSNGGGLKVGERQLRQLDRNKAGTVVVRTLVTSSILSRQRRVPDSLKAFGQDTAERV